MPEPTSAPDLFSPIQLGESTLKNRVVMAPMTRSRAADDGTPSRDAAVYYSQRASAGLLITEATCISPQAKGYAHTPGIYTDAHVSAWRQITSAVHAAHGVIYCQLWHVGRRSHPDLQPDGRLPVAPSAVRSAGNAITYTGRPPFPIPRPLDTSEIPAVAKQFGYAARCARKAGFDGIELHGANGYLIDQFLRDRTNQRSDQYGGTAENRTRFLATVLDEILNEWPAGKIGVRISPVSPVNDMGDSDPEPVFLRAVDVMNDRQVGHLHVIEGDSSGPRDIPGAFDLQRLRRRFSGTYIANNAYDRRLAQATIASGGADLVSFGRSFIANPDLVARLKNGFPLAEIDRPTLYSGGAEGYITYPAYQP